MTWVRHDEHVLNDFCLGIALTGFRLQKIGLIRGVASSFPGPWVANDFNLCRG